MKTIILFFTVIFSTLCSAGELRSDGVVLLQPDFALQEKGVEVSDLANYIKDTEAVSADAVKPSEVPPSSGFLVLAVREGNLSNAWLDMSPALPAGIEKNGFDGKAHAWAYYEKGKLVRKERDENGDGRVDYWEYRESGEVDRVGIDLDGDGRVDRWEQRKPATAEAAPKP